MTQKSEITMSILAELNDSLEDLIGSEPEKLQYWYQELNEMNWDYVDLSIKENVDLLLQSMRLVMQYEHANALELKELAEREAVEMAEKEENFEMEREMLKDEISTLRERITSKAGIDETNETFRAEIDSLTTENAFLKQIGRERDRELADLRDKSEELISRIDTLEKERTLYVTNQTQLEDTIRELNRRISFKTEVSHKSDLESRKLRQRNEQAILLSSQLQNVVSQNDELKIEIERLSKALENANKLLQENTLSYAEYDQHLQYAESSIKNLIADNNYLKKQILTKETALLENNQQVDYFSEDVLTTLHEKDAQLEREIEEYKIRLELHVNNDREEELERLRKELVSATETARKLFGTTLNDIEAKEPKQNLDYFLEVRLRNVQLDRELELTMLQLEQTKQNLTKLEADLEHKDLINARLNTENQHLKELAFGDGYQEIRRLEKQLEYREEQIYKLNEKCTNLQLEDLFKLNKETFQEPNRNTNSPSENKKLENILILLEKNEDKTETLNVKEEANIETQTEIVQTDEIYDTKPKYFMKPQSRDEMEANAAIINLLYQEIRTLNKEIENREKDKADQIKLRKDQENILRSTKLSLAEATNNLLELKKTLYGNEWKETLQPEEALQSKNHALQIERLVNSFQQNDTEIHRRMIEASRRLIFHGIQAHKLGRRAETAERICEAIIIENNDFSRRLERFKKGEEIYERRLAVENELFLIEIARLQNALLHSVPLTEYHRLLNEYKYLLHKAIFDGTSTDTGYQSLEDVRNFYKLNFLGKLI